MKGEVKERGMIFNDEMVRAILGGNKTQTRRIVEEKFYGRAVAAELLAKHCPYGQPGDRIWVRETYRVHGKATDVATLVYRASVRNSWTEQTHRVPVEVCNKPVSEKWTPSIHMPRWASRILLEITNVRVERLNDISECDARDCRVDIHWLLPLRICSAHSSRDFSAYSPDRPSIGCASLANSSFADKIMRVTSKTSRKDLLINP